MAAVKKKKKLRDVSNHEAGTGKKQKRTKRGQQAGGVISKDEAGTGKKQKRTLGGQHEGGVISQSTELHTDAGTDKTTPWQEAGRGAGKRGKGQGRGRAYAQGSKTTTKPSALKMLRPRKGRNYTKSVALPASIIDNAKTGELKAMLVGQIARALTIFSIDEVVIFEDRCDAEQSRNHDGVSRALAFFIRNLQYLEMPQYLRRQLLPMHADLKWVGLLSPLDAPHHPRRYERIAYREGAVILPEKCPKPPEGETGCWVNCGLDDPVWAVGQEIPDGLRVTIRIDQTSAKGSYLRGVPVAPTEPRTKAGFYWGFQVRIAKSLSQVFSECPFDGGYDFTVGTSERGQSFGLSAKLPQFKHLLLTLGGLGGLEEVINDELSGYAASTDPSSLFDRYVNICPEQTSRTIRTEEALLIALTLLSSNLGDR